MTRLIRAVTAAMLVYGAATPLAGLWQIPVVVFETEKGAIEIEVDTANAPLTAANFLKYVDGDFYAGGTVNRAVRPDNTARHDVEIQVIQFQIDAARRPDQFPPIALERTSITGLKHVDGAISMARSGPDTATGSFSIVIGNQPEMDFGGRRNPDGQGFAALDASSGEWMWSRRFRRRRQGQPDLLAASRWLRRSESSGLFDASERALRATLATFKSVSARPKSRRAQPGADTDPA